MTEVGFSNKDLGAGGGWCRHYLCRLANPQR
jgi:hypothetical protein